MKTITFEIPGKAVPWHRPEKNRRTGVTYKHGEDRRWQGLVRLYALQVRPQDLPTGPVVMQIDFVLERPKSLAKKILYHIKKPDKDNLTKNIKDALTGTLWKDDAQVFKSIEEKRYCIDGEKPKVLVTLIYV